MNALVLSSEIASTAYYQALSQSLRESGTKILEQAATTARDANVPFEQKNDRKDRGVRCGRDRRSG
jgi:hypothetical protein